MKVLALIGSPRKDGNTAALVEQILKGGETRENNATEQIFLYDYTILLCTDCRTCKKGITSAA